MIREIKGGHMKKIFSLLVLMTLSTQALATTLFDCRFNGQDIYKMSVLLNEGSEAVSVIFENEKPSFSYIEGRDQEVVRFEQNVDTQEYVLKAYNKDSGFPELNATFSPVDGYWSYVQMIIAQSGESTTYSGRCFVTGL